MYEKSYEAEANGYEVKVSFEIALICANFIARLSPKPQPQLGAELALVSIQPSHPSTHPSTQPSTHWASKKELEFNLDQKTKVTYLNE